MVSSFGFSLASGCFFLSSGMVIGFRRDVMALVQISFVILYFNFAPTVFNACAWLSFFPKSEGKGLV